MKTTRVSRPTYINFDGATINYRYSLISCWWKANSIIFGLHKTHNFSFGFVLMLMLMLCHNSNKTTPYLNNNVFRWIYIIRFLLYQHGLRINEFNSITLLIHENFKTISLRMTFSNKRALLSHYNRTRWSEKSSKSNN